MRVVTHRGADLLACVTLCVTLALPTGCADQPAGTKVPDVELLTRQPEADPAKEEQFSYVDGPAAQWNYDQQYRSARHVTPSTVPLHDASLSQPVVIGDGSEGLAP